MDDHGTVVLPPTVAQRLAAYCMARGRAPDEVLAELVLAALAAPAAAPAVALTARQREVLAAIDRLTRACGYPPTLRELGAAIGIRSTNGVSDHLRALERKGYLHRADATARGIRLAPPSREAA